MLFRSGTLFPVGPCGDDGEGWSLRRALSVLPGVRLDAFVTASDRHTFTYSKPLVHHVGQPPEELSRLDQKNWTPTPGVLGEQMAASVLHITGEVDGSIVMDQVDLEGTGTVTREVIGALARRSQSSPDALILADSRTPLPDAQAVASGTLLSTDSIVGIPLKREALHRWAAQNGIDLDGESVVEVEADTDPDHPLMNGITGTNDQVPVNAAGYKSPVLLAPAMGTTPISIDAALGALKWLRMPPLAVGIGIYLPMTATFAVVIGSLCSKWYEGVAARAANPGRAERLGTLVASGLIVGESLWGVINAGLIVGTSKDAPLGIVPENFDAAPWLGVGLFVASVVWIYGWMRRKAH